MMTEARLHRRYPGPQPFTDDPLSRELFFGRDNECRRLIDQILANRLTIIYARSGAGKSSLLNAAVAPGLRELGYAPLLTRVNDLAAGPVQSVINTALAHAARQELEVIGAAEPALPAFLAETEFWLGDRLLRPVLMIDQFEELFTLNAADAQDAFLGQLADVLRDQTAATIVLALREDYVIFLEDAAGHIPRILDHRFRLAALRLADAREALARPAEIHDRPFVSRPFRIEANAIDEVLTYVSRLTTDVRDIKAGHIEPFFLQLICSHFETLAINRQRAGDREVVLASADLGGAKALDKLLRDFIKTAVNKTGGFWLRGRVMKLCERELINIDHRRVSLEEAQAIRRTGVPRRALNILVAERVLRCDARGDMKYYELSHDAMVELILGRNRRSKILFSRIMIVASAVGLGCMVIFLILCIYLGFTSERQNDMYLTVGVLVVLFNLVTIIALLYRAIRSNMANLKRFSESRRQRITAPPRRFFRRRSKS